MRIGNDIDIRLGLVVLILTLQAGMFVDYGHRPETCPNTECLLADYDRYVGESVRLGGIVVETDPPTIVLRGERGATLPLRLVGVDPSVSRNDKVDVYGTVAPDRTITVQDFVVKQATDRRYMFGISLVGIVLIVAFGRRRWRFDPGALVFRRRERK